MTIILISTVFILVVFNFLLLKYSCNKIAKNDVSNQRPFIMPSSELEITTELDSAPLPSIAS